MTSTDARSRNSLQRDLLRLAMLGWLLVFCLGAAGVQAGAACVVVKKKGNSVAIEWAAHPEADIRMLLDGLENRLRDQGYPRDRHEDLFPQSNTDLAHAHVVIVRTEYPNARGKPRTSYGCGYSDLSAVEAEWAALRDLQAYSWGWVPSKGYEVIARFRY